MGMDVYGKNPRSEVGEYFRRSVWGWHPLARLVCVIEPDLTKRCARWHSNDGDGLDAAGAEQLAEILEVALDDGTVDRLVKEREKYLASLPDEQCKFCNGTGIRRDERAKQVQMDKEAIPANAKHPYRPEEPHPRAGQKGTCNACSGVGATEPADRWYHVDTDDVREFASFLKDCGGFEIC